MPRFRDDWLIDRVMFDYVSGGSCACCGMSHSATLFLPNGAADLIRAVSDLETNQAQHEIKALNNHQNNPWPKDLRDQVWADRVRLRQHLKRDLKVYQEFWTHHGSNLRSWMLQSPATIKRIFQVSRSEISAELKERYNIDSAYGVVLCAAMEQVAHFDLTQYDCDAGWGGDSAKAEREFEQLLIFDRRLGFTLRNLVQDDGALNEDAVDVWCTRFATLCGPTLLAKRVNQGSVSNQGDDSDSDGNTNSPDSPIPPSTLPPVSTGPSFQSDRRVLRLVIARYWANLLMKAYQDEAVANSGCSVAEKGSSINLVCHRS